MKFKCCDALLHRLTINMDSIDFCCSPYQDKLRYLNNYEDKLIDIEDYKQKREYYIEKFKANDLPEPCQNCEYCKEDNWDEKPGLTLLSVATETKCNCDCFYCVHSKGDPNTKKWLNERKGCDIKPLIKDLYNNDLIRPNCLFVIGGGEPTLFSNNDLEYFLYIGILTKAHIIVLSNGIIFNENISKLLSVADLEFKVSVDAGTKETYEKIKRVKEFDTVWKNLETYAKAAKNNPIGKVQIKYLLIPGINDNMKDISAFTKKCFAIGCNHIEIAIENDWYGENKDKPISKELKDAILYFKSLRNQGVFFGEEKDWFEKQTEE